MCVIRYSWFQPYYLQSRDDILGYALCMAISYFLVVAAGFALAFRVALQDEHVQYALEEISTSEIVKSIFICCSVTFVIGWFATRTYYLFMWNIYQNRIQAYMNHGFNKREAIEHIEPKQRCICCK
jgi:hypothetical protein